MSNVKFISYDGKYPCLCQGTLVIEVKGKTYELKNVLCSGGDCGYSPGLEITEAPWTIEEFFLPDELKPYIDEITYEVNCSVPWGCCGGCI